MLLLEFNCGILELFQQSVATVLVALMTTPRIFWQLLEQWYGTIVYTWPSSRMQVVQL
jgi:hypothetical protein